MRKDIRYRRNWLTGTVSLTLNGKTYKVRRYRFHIGSRWFDEWAVESGNTVIGSRSTEVGAVTLAELSLMATATVNDNHAVAA